MEELYDSSIPGLLRANVRTQKEAGRMIAVGHPHAPDYIDLQLIPDFMKAKDGVSMVGDTSQRNIAEEVLNGLHVAWNGGESIENALTESFIENYWEFVDNDFTPWTVVELHNTNPTENEVGVSAYILRGPKRPTAFQLLLDNKGSDSNRTETVHKDLVRPHETAFQKPSRRQRVAKSIAGWLNNQSNQPRRPFRIE